MTGPPLMWGSVAAVSLTKRFPVRNRQRTGTTNSANLTANLTGQFLRKSCIHEPFMISGPSQLDRPTVYEASARCAATQEKMKTAGMNGAQTDNGSGGRVDGRLRKQSPRRPRRRRGVRETVTQNKQKTKQENIMRVKLLVQTQEFQSWPAWDYAQSKP